MNLNSKVTAKHPCVVPMEAPTLGTFNAVHPRGEDMNLFLATGAMEVEGYPGTIPIELVTALIVIIHGLIVVETRHLYHDLPH